MRALLENFCVFHVNAPGQEENAPTFPDEWVSRNSVTHLTNLIMMMWCVDFTQERVKPSSTWSNIFLITILLTFLSFASFVYPTMDELAAQLLFVLSHFGLKSVIGFGVGAGANILTRFALQQPDKVSIQTTKRQFNHLSQNDPAGDLPAGLSASCDYHTLIAVECSD